MMGENFVRFQGAGFMSMMVYHDTMGHLTLTFSPSREEGGHNMTTANFSQRIFV
jgi:ribosomal protein S19